MIKPDYYIICVAHNYSVNSIKVLKFTVIQDSSEREENSARADGGPRSPSAHG